jgi:outer membrane protein TolC
MKEKKLKYWILLFTVHCSLFTVSAQDSLNCYLKIAAENNPAVKAAFHTYEASLQKAPQMGAYDDPQLEIGFFLEPMDLVGGREPAQFQLMQMFPWFGTKKAARTEAQHMAKMTFEEFREAKDNVYLQVYTQWYILCSLQQKLSNNEENKKLLQQLEDLALRKFSSGGAISGTTGERQKTQSEGTTSTVNNSMSGMNMGSSPTAPATSPSGELERSGNRPGQLGVNMNMSGSSSSGMSEVLRIQLEIVELESNMESIRSEIKAEKARFNTLLNRPVESEIVIPEAFTQLPFLFDTETAKQTIAEQNPMLGMIAEESLAYQAKAEMNKKMGYPMFGIGLQYMWIKPPKSPTGGTSEMSAMQDMQASPTGDSMNGKDMVMPMISISIPIYRNKYKAAQKENKFLQLANQEKRTDTFNRLQADLFQFKHQVDDASRKIALYKKQAEIARITSGLVTQEFVSGKSDLSGVLQVHRQLLDYQLKEAEAIAAYNTMVANIQKIMSSYENKE